MEIPSPDPDATLSRPRPRGARLRTGGVAVLAFALGGLTVAAVPLARSWMNAEPAIFSTLRIRPKESWLVAQPSFEDAHREQVRELKIHQELIRSVRVLRLALASPELQKTIERLTRQSDPMNWIREHLQVEVLEDTSFIRLSIRGAAPEEQVALVNAVTNSFLRVSREYSEGSNSKRLRAIEKALGMARGMLAEQRKSLIESETKDDGVKAAALRDEIAVMEELFKRHMTAFEEMKLQREYPWEGVDLLDIAVLPKVE